MKNPKSHYLAFIYYALLSLSSDNYLNPELYDERKIMF